MSSKLSTLTPFRSKIRSRRAQTSLLSSSCFKNECTSGSGSQHSRCARSMYSSASPHDCSIKRLELHLPLSASNRGVPIYEMNFKNRSGYSIHSLFSHALSLSLSHAHALFLSLLLSINYYCVLSWKRLVVTFFSLIAPGKPVWCASHVLLLPR